jgi:glucose/arabinose dehydrogenase
VPTRLCGRYAGFAVLLRIVYEDFLTGFVVNNESVWGRPVGITIAHDGSLLVTDDGSNSIWRVSYTDLLFPPKCGRSAF